MLEIEVKIKVDKEKIKNDLINLGFIKESHIYEHDSYFNGDNCNLKNEDKALRIREHIDLKSKETIYQLNYKGPKIDSISMTRQEVEFTVPSFEQGEAFLNGIGYHVAGEVEKTRYYYKKDDITCCLDTVTSLGDFLEIEIIATEDKYDDSMTRINSLLNQLSLSMDDSINTSYLSMLSKNISNKVR